MENTEVGGNRGNTADGGEIFSAPEAPDLTEAQKSLGEAALAMPEMGEAPDFSEMMRGAPEKSAEQEVLEFSQMAEMTEAPEAKPLAADGSTERKMGKIAIDLSGDVMDKAAEKEVRGEVEKLKDKPYELANYRDEEMAESLRNNWGRIFGNDQGEAA